MKRTLIPIFALVATLHADEGILLQRIVALEKRVAELEQKLAPVLEEERVKEIAERQKELARERMMLDAEMLSRLDLQLIEKAYQTAAQNWKSEEAEKALTLLREKYPRANRTGCAVLAMAQSSEGEKQIRLLEEAIEKYGGAYYLNGVNVGAYARLYLGMRLKKDGNDEAAEKLFQEVRTSFPNAVDHNGQLLTAHLEGLE